jgi:hypothetical protein
MHEILPINLVLPYLALPYEMIMFDKFPKLIFHEWKRKVDARNFVGGKVE